MPWPMPAYCTCNSTSWDFEGAKINAGDYDGRTPLHLAASEGHYEICNALLQAKADPQAVDRWGGTPLMDSYRERRTDAAQLLAEHGASWDVIGTEKSGFWFGSPSPFFFLNPQKFLRIHAA
jgi:hypothetical protein